MSDQTRGRIADQHRTAIYQAEDRIIRIMSLGDRQVIFDGGSVELPALVHFGDQAAAQSFVDMVLADPRVTGRYPQAGPVTVDFKPGYGAALYSNGVIRLPKMTTRGNWASNANILLHELAHHLAPGDQHQAEFRRTLIQLYDWFVSPGAGAFLATIFRPYSALDAQPTDQDPVRRRISALLAKAAATDSDAESAACLGKATALAAAHSLDLAAHAQTTGRPTHRHLDIGPLRARTNRALIRLYIALSAPFDVKVNIGPGSTYVVGYGIDRDLDQLEAIFVAAATALVAGTTRHMAATSGEPAPSQRRTGFQLGFVQEIGRAMRKQSAELPVSDPESQALVVAERRDVIAKYYRAHSDAKGTWQGHLVTRYDESSRKAGAQAARAFLSPGLPGRRAIGN